MIYLLRNHEVLSWQCFIINSLGQVPLTWDRNEKNCGVMSSVMVPPTMMFLSTFPAHLLSMTTTHIFSDNYNRTTRQKDSWEALEFFFSGYSASTVHSSCHEDWACCCYRLATQATLTPTHTALTQAHHKHAGRHSIRDVLAQGNQNCFMAQWIFLFALAKLKWVKIINPHLIIKAFDLLLV